jgi:hypothetical protein
MTLKDIGAALIEAGICSLDEQARALGVHRSTAWTIMRATHKCDRLSTKSRARILASRHLPPGVRPVIQAYIAANPLLRASQAVTKAGGLRSSRQ